MADLQTFLKKLHKNLNILREREAKYGGNVPLDLLNQIDDHQKAIVLTEQAIAGELSRAEWHDALKPLLVEIAARTGEAASSVTMGDIEGGIHDSTIAGGDVVGRDKVGGDKVGRDQVIVGTLIINYPLPPPTVTEADTAAAEPIPDCPYRGLFAFRPEHAHLFFGRETFTQQLAETVESRPFVAVLGASGSGKSSLVFAGLVPALLNQSGEPWLFTTFRPGDDPFLGLASALVPLLEPDLSKIKQIGEARDLAARLREGHSPLSDYVNSVHQTHPDQRLLIIADQFEELYTLCRDPEARQQFLAVLLDLIKVVRGASPRLVLTLRADFLGQASLYAPFAKALDQAGTTKILGPMTRAEMTEAIEKPAARQKVSFEANLVDRLLNDVGEEEGSLPLLEFALTELWQHQRQRTLTHVAYEEIGKINGALSRHADKAFQGLTPAEQEQARQIFVQLVNPGAGTQDTRRLATRTELDPNWSLVTKLANERLVVTNQVEHEPETVEVVHEALIRNWQQLQVWMEQDREFLTWRLSLRADLKRWQETNHDEGALLRGAPLLIAKEKLAERSDDLTLVERDFIQASVALREREVAEKEAQRQRELEYQRTLAEEQHQRAEEAEARRKEQQEANANLRQRAMWVVMAGVVAVVLAIVAVIFGVQSNRNANLAATREAEAKAQANLALSRQLAAQALANLDNQFDRALLLSLEANRIANTVEARSSLLAGLTSHPQLVTFLHGHTDRVISVAFSPDGKTLASSSLDQTIRLWDVVSGQLLGHPLTGHTGEVTSVAFSPDGKTLASGGADQTIRLWDVVSGQPVGKPLTGHTDRVTSVAFSPDGKTLASGGLDQTIRLWDVVSGQPVSQFLTGHTDRVTSVAFSPDGKTLASSSRDQTIRLWDVVSGQPVGKPLTGRTGEVTSVAFSPDGKTLASGGVDHTIRLWDVDLQSWLAHACHIANRNLTRAEWAQFIGATIPYQPTCPNLPPAPRAIGLPSSR